MSRNSFCLAIAALSLTLASRSGAETVGTLSLDGLSFVSFEDEQVLPLAGSIRFHFGEPQSDGSIPFSIGSGDVSIPDISLPTGKTLRYDLASASGGRLRPSATGHIVQFSATVTATLIDGEEQGTFSYGVPFTTETVSAGSGGHNIQVSGARIAPGARYLQLVGVAVNKPNAEPEPGATVYTVLSGTFDQVP